jgi:hypothetical protein
MLFDNYILTEVELFGSFYLNFQFTPLYGLNQKLQTVEMLIV